MLQLARGSTVAATLLLGLMTATATAGCGASSGRRLSPRYAAAATAFGAGRAERPRDKPRRAPAPDEAMVERALHARGLRFGTDGSTRALWGYLRTSHQVVPASQARPGDVVLFDLWGLGPRPGCADHAGIVEAVDPDGRIQFVERRAGRVQRSFVHPALPTARRDPGGRVLNTFLRPMRIDEPSGARHFAGEMICAVVRVERAP